MKKITCIFIALVLIFTMSCQAFAGFFPENGNTSSEYFDTNLQISGTNSFGNMLSETIGDELNKQQENAGYNVISVEISGQTATVELETLCDSTVVVGIYDEPGVNLLMTASAPVTQDDEYVTVTFAQALPQYFFIKAYLVDRTTLRPLCTVYDCPNYTQEMQEFFAKTVYDFEPEKVLNLDSDVTNNFAVYSDNVTVIPRVEGVNTLVSQGEGVCVFAAADENIRSLRPGQIFSYEYAPGEVIIAKVAAVMENPDGTVAVSEQDTELEDAFEYIKIDASADLDDATVDNSHLGEGVTYVGEHYSGQQPRTQGGISPFALEGGDSEKLYKEYNFEFTDETDVTKINCTASLSLCLEASIKYYISWSYQYIEAKIRGTVDADATFEFIFSTRVKLGDFSFNIVPGVVTLKVTPELILEASAIGHIHGTFEAMFGARASSDKGAEPLKSSHGEINGDVEARFYVGLSLTPSISIISEKIAPMTLNGTIGAEIKAKMSVHYSTDEPRENVYHECHECLEGSVNVLIDGYFNVKLLNCKKLSYERKFPKDGAYAIKICDFYSSADFGDSGFGTCPHYKYLYTVHVIGNWLRPLEGAKVELDGVSYTTDSAGDAKFYILKDKEYTATVSTDGYKPKTVDIHLSNILDLLLGSYNKKTVCLIDWDSIIDYVGDIGSGGGGGGSWGGDVLLPDGSKRVKQVSLGNSHSAAITVDGCLYMWGDNEFGQLGNGKSGGDPFDYDEGIDSNVPIKIMDNVASVSLGTWHSAAITTDGSLYMWGYNSCGQLGNGTTEDSYVPIKIMDNVASVSLGQYHTGAITTNGSLYMWGSNICGQLGDGKSGGGYYDYDEGIDSDVPIKIMDNIASVSLGTEHSSAITTDGSLYMWGNNSVGQLGSGKNGGDFFDYDEGFDSNVPIKILDGVVSVSLGNSYSSAITADGSLYMWGRNVYDRFGNGTVMNIYVPIITMDNVASVSLEFFHSAAITTDGSLYIWGWNEYGQLGDGTTENSPVPIKISIPADEPAPTSISTLSALPMAVAEPSPTSGTFTGLLPNEIYNIYALRSRTAAEPLAASNLLYIAQATSDAAGNLPYNCELLEDCPNPIIFCKAMHEFALGNAEITAADVTRDSITVKWEPYPGADMYRVYRVMNGVYILEGETPSTEYTVSGLAAGSEYGFVVECRVNGEWSYHASDDVVYIGTESEPEFTPGDVNSDGRITSVDAVLVLRYLANFRDENANQDAMDYNGAGGITSLDAVLILRHIAGLD